MKKVMVTGASSGIGAEIARKLAELDFRVTLVGRDETRLQETLKSLKGSAHAVLIADLNNEKDLAEVAAQLQHKKYDVLINNAGAGLYGQFASLSLEKQLGIMQLNMNALTVLSYHFLQGAVPGDALVNIGSILAHSSLPGAAVYAATKSYVATFSESLWYEYEPKGIFVMGFHPGATVSTFHSNAGGETRDFPDFVLSSVEEVAGELVSALTARKKPRAVQGWKNRLMLLGFRFLPRKVAIKIMGSISPGIQRRPRIAHAGMKAEH